MPGVKYTLINAAEAYHVASRVKRLHRSNPPGSRKLVSILNKISSAANNGEFRVELSEPRGSDEEQMHANLLELVRLGFRFKILPSSSATTYEVSWESTDPDV